MKKKLTLTDKNLSKTSDEIELLARAQPSWWMNPNLSLEALYRGALIAPWYVEKNPALPLISLESPGEYQALLEHIIEGWRSAGFNKLSDRAKVLYAADCALHVLPIFEKQFPKNGVLRSSIEIACKFMDGKASVADLKRIKTKASDMYSRFHDEGSMIEFITAAAADVSAFALMLSTGYSQEYNQCEAADNACIAAALYFSEKNSGSSYEEIEKLELKFQANLVKNYYALEHPEVIEERVEGRYPIRQLPSSKVSVGSLPPGSIIHYATESISDIDIARYLSLKFWRERLPNYGQFYQTFGKECMALAKRLKDVVRTKGLKRRSSEIRRLVALFIPGQTTLTWTDPVSDIAVENYLETILGLGESEEYQQFYLEWNWLSEVTDQIQLAYDYSRCKNVTQWFIDFANNDLMDALLPLIERVNEYDEEAIINGRAPEPKGGWTLEGIVKAMREKKGWWANLAKSSDPALNYCFESEFTLAAMRQARDEELYERIGLIL